MSSKAQSQSEILNAYVNTRSNSNMHRPIVPLVALKLEGTLSAAVSVMTLVPNSLYSTTSDC